MQKERNPKHLEEKLQVDMSLVRSVRKHSRTQNSFVFFGGTESHYVDQAGLALTKICLPLPSSAGMKGMHSALSQLRNLFPMPAHSYSQHTEHVLGMTAELSVHAAIPALNRMRHKNCVFETSLSYRVSFRSAWARARPQFKSN